MTEDDLAEFLLSFLPDSVEGWSALVLLAFFVASLALPKPREDSHPLWKTGHKLICILGFGACKLKSAGRIGRIGRLFGRKK